MSEVVGTERPEVIDDRVALGPQHRGGRLREGGIVEQRRLPVRQAYVGSAPVGDGAGLNDLDQLLRGSLAVLGAHEAQ